LLSSAILYVAIVAIWACVLVPRWLRRDSALPSPAPTEEQVSDDGTAAAEADEEPAPPRRRRLRAGHEDDAGEWRSAPGVADERTAPGRAADERPAPGEDRGMPRGLAHRRVLSSRRRLLGMLVVLTIGSGVLAGTRLAAWWVIVPPSVMLLCYLLLLRAAAKADAERRELTRAWTAEAAVTEDSGAAGVPGAPGVRNVRRAATASRAEIIDISASRGPAAQGSHGGQGTQAGHEVRGGEEIYDQDEDARLRAVGD
jgi:hypothetical protein